MLKLPHCRIELDAYEQKQLYAFMVKVWTDTNILVMDDEPQASRYLAAALLDRYFTPTLVSKIKAGLHTGKFRLGLPEAQALFLLINQYDLSVLNEYEPMVSRLIQVTHPFLLECSENPTLRLFQNVEVSPY